MAVSKYNITDLAGAIFGTQALPFPNVNTEESRENVAEGFDEATPAKQDDSVKAVKGSFNWKGMLGNEYFMPMKINDWQLPNEPLVRITGGKKINKTSPNRGKMRGTVKEEWSLKDYKIRVRGFIVNEEAYDYPKELVRRMRQLVEKSGALSITSEYTSIWGIDQVMIEQWDFPEGQGQPDVQPYTLTLISDQEFSLELIEDESS